MEGEVPHEELFQAAVSAGGGRVPVPVDSGGRAGVRRTLPVGLLGLVQHRHGYCGLAGRHLDCVLPHGTHLQNRLDYSHSGVAALRHLLLSALRRQPAVPAAETADADGAANPYGQPDPGYAGAGAGAGVEPRRGFAVQLPDSGGRVPRLREHREHLLRLRRGGGGGHAGRHRPGRTVYFPGVFHHPDRAAVGTDVAASAEEGRCRCGCPDHL